MSTAVTAPVETADVELSLRHFFANGPNPEHHVPAPDLLPASLHPFHDSAHLRYEYPVFLFPPGPGNRMYAGLSELLQEAADRLDPAKTDVKVVKDNLGTFEFAVRALLGDQSAPIEAAPLFTEAAGRTLKQVGWEGERAEKLKGDLKHLVSALPHKGQLLNYSSSADLYLLSQTVRHTSVPLEQAFRLEVETLNGHLGELLAIERSKTAEGTAKANGSLGKFIDAQALARVAHKSGSLAMEQERLGRLTEAYETLRKFLEGPKQPLFVIIYDGKLPEAFLSQNPDVKVVHTDNPFLAASSYFHAESAAFAPVIRAARVARTELEGRYELAHLPALEDFHWEAFTADELLALPPVFAVSLASEVKGEAFAKLSQTLRSGLPIHLVVHVDAARNMDPPLSKTPFTGYHLELGYLGVAFRQAAVQQSSAARPSHFLDGLIRSLSSSRTSLHVLLMGEPKAKKAPTEEWLYVGAALESRAHPFFSYFPDAASIWAGRFDFSGNPQPERDWPVVDAETALPGNEESKAVSFTFADFALLDSEWRSHFTAVPKDFESEALEPLDRYLTLDELEAARKIPFIWSLDEAGNWQRLGVSCFLTFACRDRLDYWRTLQEFSGVKSYHAAVAAEKARSEALAEARAEREQLEAAHAAELEKVRSEAAGEAMQRLVSVLLDLDSAALPAGAPKALAKAAPTPLVVTPAEAKAPEVPTPVVEETGGFDEPWIDSVLCTSCNDCININNRMFGYNENKQATISDPKAGTFAELVRAAEKCTARCIHPGKPLNPGEPGLEDLIKRAAVYN